MIVALAGGVGAARMLRGIQAVVPPETVTAIVNTGDDIVLHGLHVSPDLDTVTYTLAGAINHETGWGLVGETWAAMDALERYHGQTWFRLGDRDLATHLYRTQRLAEGASLSEVTAEIAAAWGLGLRLLPMSDDRVETRVTVAGEEIGFQEYFVGRQHSVPVAAVRFDGAEAARPGPGVLDALAEAERVVICPSTRSCRSGPSWPCPASGDRWSPAATTWWPCRPSWPAPPSRARPTACSPSWATRRRWSAWPASTPPGGHARDRRGRRRPGRRGGGGGHALRGHPHDHVGAGRAAARRWCWPREPIPERGPIRRHPGRRHPRGPPGDDLAELIAAEPNLLDGDVVVVTQKIVSKAEGRLVPVDPTDPLGHKALVEEEAVRMLRRRGDLIISETNHGFVCANAGVDLSNVDDGWAALLPDDSDRSARRIRDGLRARARGRGRRDRLRHLRAGVAQGPHRRRHRLRRHGRHRRPARHPDALGRMLQVTEVAVADELAAAAELVMGKSSGIPVAVVRGVDPTWLRDGAVRDELVRPPAEDLFR